MACVPLVREGTVDFSYPTLPKPCSTWYKIVGDIKASSTRRPLVLFHGGPGACHNYLKPLEMLAVKHGVSLVYYDQLGNGKSTRLREKRLDTDFWTPALFIAEWENLRRHLDISAYDLLGHSWGGMLGAQYAITQPVGLSKLVISNSPASMKPWIESCHERLRGMPGHVLETIQKYEKLQDYENQEYRDAVLYFYQHHLCLKRGENGQPFPEPVMESLGLIEEDDTVYFTMNGPSEFTVTGNLREWSVADQVQHIRVPTLLVTADLDEATETCWGPFIKGVPDVRVVCMKNASHMAHVDHNQEYCDAVASFLESN